MARERIETDVEITFSDSETPAYVGFPQGMELTTDITFIDVFPLTNWKQTEEGWLLVGEAAAGTVKSRGAKYGSAKYCEAAYQEVPS